MNRTTGDIRRAVPLLNKTRRAAGIGRARGGRAIFARYSLIGAISIEDGRALPRARRTCWCCSDGADRRAAGQFYLYAAIRADRARLFYSPPSPAPRSRRRKRRKGKPPRWALAAHRLQVAGAVQLDCVCRRVHVQSLRRCAGGCSKVLIFSLPRRGLFRSKRFSRLLHQWRRAAARQALRS